jgi:hypothetical protein
MLEDNSKIDEIEKLNYDWLGSYMLKMLFKNEYVALETLEGNPYRSYTNVFRLITFDK